MANYKTSKYKKLIKSFIFEEHDINGGGEDRKIQVIGDKNAVFTLEITNEDGHYYNFTSKKFSSTYSRLYQKTLTAGYYVDHIVFPSVSDDDHYNIRLFAEPGLDTGLSRALGESYNSSMVLKKIQQYTNKTITLTAISPNSITAFSGVSITTDTFTTSRGKSSGKVPFKVIATVGTTRNVSINRQPIASDVITFVERTIGSAAIPIRGEDVSSSTFYKWPINNIVGLQEGMFVNSSNITAGSTIKSYRSATYVDTKALGVKTKKQETFLEKGIAPILNREYGRSAPQEIKTSKTRTITEEAPRNTIQKAIDEIYEPALQGTGEPVLTDNVLTSQAGNIIFSNQQVDALKDDSVKIYGYGREAINSLSSYDIEFTDLKVELTEVTTTVDGAVSNNTGVTVDERAGIRDGDFSTVTGIGIDTSSAIPTVTSGAGAVNGGGELTLSAAQTLEDGITLTFGNASRIATITGNINIIKGGLEDLTLRFDLERFLLAV